MVDPEPSILGFEHYPRFETFIPLLTIISQGFYILAHCHFHYEGFPKNRIHSGVNLELVLL